MKHLHFQLKMRNWGTIILETLGDCGRNCLLLLSSLKGPGNVCPHLFCGHLSCKYSLNTISFWGTKGRSLTCKFLGLIIQTRKGGNGDRGVKCPALYFGEVSVESYLKSFLRHSSLVWLLTRLIWATFKLYPARAVRGAVPVLLSWAREAGSHDG